MATGHFAIKFTRVRLRKIHPALLVWMSLSLLSAQTARKPSPALPPSAFKLLSIKVAGSKRFAPEQVIAAAGLQVGQTVSEEDFKKASQRLGETGAFSDVAYAFKFSGEGAKLDLQVADSGRLVPAVFDNFVWLRDDELLKQLRAIVPLFDGQLPVAGNLPDQVAETLQAVTIEHNVQGRVDYLRFAKQEGPIEAFVFTITGPVIHIRDVEFKGVEASELPALQDAAKRLAGEEYLRSAVRVQAEKDLLPIYLQRGYLKASFSDAEPRIAQENKAAQESTQQILVDITFPVTPGLQYRAAEIQFSGNKAFLTEKLRELIHQQLGQPANKLRLDEDLTAIQKVYGTRGYMAASIQSTPEMDDAQSTVKYVLQCHEGDVYKMGDLDIRGLDSHTTARLGDAWKLRSGDPYDNSYYQRFLTEADKLVPGGPWKISFHETPDDKDKTVDVTLRFDPQAR